MNIATGGVPLSLIEALDPDESIGYNAVALVELEKIINKLDWVY